MQNDKEKPPPASPRGGELRRIIIISVQGISAGESPALQVTSGRGFCFIRKIRFLEQKITLKLCVLNLFV